MSIVRNSGYNLAAALAPAVISFVTVPLYIRSMGEARYGVMTIFAMLLGYFGVLDLGLSRAVAQRIAAARNDRGGERPAIFWSGAIVNLGLGLLGGVVILPVAHWMFATEIKMPANLRPEMLTAAPWLALALPITLVTQVLRGAMQGAEQFASLNLITTLGSIFSQLVTLAVALWITPQLTVILPVMFISRLFSLAGMAWQVRRRILTDIFPRFELRRALDLLSFGGWVALSGLVSPLMTTLDRFLIGSVVSAGAVSQYTVPYQLGERTLIVPTAVADALFPRVASGSAEGARKLALDTMSVLSAIITPAMVCLILILQMFISIWISPDFAAHSAGPGRILMAGFCLNAFAFSFFVCLQAGGRPRLVALAHLVEVGPFLALLYFGLKFWGLTGAAVAFSLRVALDSFLLAHFAGVLKGAIRLAALPVVLLALALAVAPSVTLSSLSGLAAAACLAGVSAVFGLRRLAFHGLSPARIIELRRTRRAAAGH